MDDLGAHAQPDDQPWWANVTVTAPPAGGPGPMPGSQPRKPRPNPSEAPQSRAEFGADTLIGAYAALGLEPGAGSVEIQAAYRELSKKHHPDRLLGAPEADRRHSEQRMRDLNEAITTLSQLVEAPAGVGPEPTDAQAPGPQSTAPTLGDVAPRTPRGPAAPADPVDEKAMATKNRWQRFQFGVSRGRAESPTADPSP